MIIMVPVMLYEYTVFRRAAQPKVNPPNWLSLHAVRRRKDD